MTGTNIHHALGLHMHQPPGNLRSLIEANPWEAEQIVRCYERAARYAELYRDVARLHVGFSGVLLEQLIDPDIVDRYRHIVDIPAFLDRYRRLDNVELIGMGYYHPIFPLIPRADWEEQLLRGRAIIEQVFGRAPRGFWPPEMAFSMDLVPTLAKVGYEYVVVDGVHVRPQDGVHDIYRPYLACQGGVCIAVIPRDQAISNGQESGFDPAWLADETHRQIRASPRPDAPRLVTTWSDGENGGWFRQTHEPSGFFGHFFGPSMELVRRGECALTPVALSAYLDRYPPTTEVQVQTGAWNVRSTSGNDFSQWIGSAAQRRASEEVNQLSRRYWDLNRQSGYLGADDRQVLAEARGLILEAQTSCFLFWGNAWIPQLTARTEAAGRALDRVAQAICGVGGA
jgi:alpha-amylase/alpha-mannosidase (GH57 family)